MRKLALLAGLATVALTQPAEGRLFWQTYGSVVADPASPCGCTWNSNQDYFVPRHCDSCRYGMFSPCKQSCTTSPACKWMHPWHQGYCSPYGPCHYKWRNHVYCAHCCCGPVKPYCGPVRACHCCLPLKQRCCGGGCGQGCGFATAGYAGQPQCWQLPNNGPQLVMQVDPPGFVVLGSIPTEGNEILAGLALESAGATIPQLDEAIVSPIPSLRGLPANLPGAAQ